MDVLPALRDQRGKPAGPLRLLAVLVLVGMLMIAAPVLVRCCSGRPRCSEGAWAARSRKLPLGRIGAAYADPAS